MMPNLLHNTFTQRMGSIIHALRWPFRKLLSPIAKLFVVPYTFDWVKKILVTEENRLFLDGKKDPDLSPFECTLARQLQGYNGISYTIEPKTVQNQKDAIQHMVIFMGNASIVTSHYILEIAKFAASNQIRITVIQNPGLLECDKGREPQIFSDLVDNGEKVVQAVKNQFGLDSKHILLYGHSLGGGVASQVATRFYRSEQDCPHLLVDRSFASISRVGAIRFVRLFLKPLFYGLLLPILVNFPKHLLNQSGIHAFDASFSTGHRFIVGLHNVLTFLATLILSAVLKTLLLLCGWECHTGLHYSLLPKSKKHYLFVREEGVDVGGMNSIYEDYTIPLFASLDYSLFLKPAYWFQKMFYKLQVKMGYRTTEEYHTAIKGPRRSQKLRYEKIAEHPESYADLGSHAVPLYHMNARRHQDIAATTPRNGDHVLQERLQMR